MPTPRELHAQALRKAKARRAAQVQAAREDPAAFIEFVFEDEDPRKAGRRIRNAKHHVEWQRHLSAHDFALIIAPIEHGKTAQIVVGRLLWEIGKNANFRTALVGGNVDLAKKPLKKIRQLIDGDTAESRRMREVFPDLVPSEDPTDPWTDTQITVKRAIKSRDPTIAAFGAHGKILGSRLDVILVDDVLNQENTNTELQRKKMIAWLDGEVQSRQTEGCRFWMVGTPWHKEDALHEMAKRKGISALWYSAVLNPDADPSKWIPIWPDQWPLRRILKRRETSTETEFQRTLLCRVRLDATARIKEAWLLTCARLGRGRSMSAFAPKTGAGAELPCFTGVDLGAGKKKTNASTVVATIALMPNGRFWPVEIDGGIFTSPEIVDKLASVHSRYGSKILVESNAAQIYISQFAQLRGIDVDAFYTGQNKWDPRYGVEAMAVSFRQGGWIFPCRDDSDFTDVGKVHWASDGLKSFITGALYFDPEQHTNDYLMAVWLAVECARRYMGNTTTHEDLLAR